LADVKNNFGPRGGRGGVVLFAKWCAAAYRAGVIVGTVDVDIVDVASEQYDL
jgi:hypothetical protein